MRLLVDSCVWSLALRRRKSPGELDPSEARLVAALSDAIRDGRVLVAGPIRQELLSGIRFPQHFDRVRAHLDAFPDLPIEPADYVQAARFDNLCRAAGHQRSPIDMLLCAIASRLQCTVLTSDAGLHRCLHIVQQHLRANGLLRAPQSLIEQP